MLRLNRTSPALIALALASLTHGCARRARCRGRGAGCARGCARGRRGLRSACPRRAQRTPSSTRCSTSARLQRAARRPTGIKWGGYAELGMAYTYRDPDRWSHLRARGELTGSGQLRAAGALEADCACRSRWRLRPRGRTLSRGGAPRPAPRLHAARGLCRRRSWRLGVPSRPPACDLGRDGGLLLRRRGVRARHARFPAAELERMRIGQWAARAEYFGADTHFELLWVPKPELRPHRQARVATSIAYPWMPAGTVVSEDEPGGRPRRRQLGCACLASGRWVGPVRPSTTAATIFPRR